MLIYSGSLVLESRESIRQRLAHIASIHELITENSRDAIMLADFNGNRSYASAAVERIIGMSPEEFDRHKSLDLVHPEDLPRAISIVKELQRGADGASIECRVLKNTGDYIWVEASLRVVRAPGTGVPTGVLNIVRDVTERKRTEQLRAFHHSVIRAIYDVSLEGILVVNSEGYVVSYNQRFSEIWKIAKSEIPEEKDSALMPAEYLLSLIVRQVSDPEAYRNRVHELYANPDLIGPGERDSPERLENARALLHQCPQRQRPVFRACLVLSRYIGTEDRAGQTRGRLPCRRGACRNRPDDRAGQPASLRQGAEQRVAPRASRSIAALAPHDRRRSLQVVQRLVRPHAGR